MRRGTYIHNLDIAKTLRLFQHPRFVCVLSHNWLKASYLLKFLHYVKGR